MSAKARSKTSKDSDADTAGRRERTVDVQLETVQGMVGKLRFLFREYQSFSTMRADANLQKTPLKVDGIKNAETALKVLTEFVGKLGTAHKLATKINQPYPIDEPAWDEPLEGRKDFAPE